MSDEITKDRSPRSPMVSLEDALEVVRRLYAQARMTAVKPESAVKALGYSGMTGSSMTMLASLGQYGLLDRTSGNVSVSPLAVRVLHPSSEAQRDSAIREAASLPKVFQGDLKGFEHCSAEIVANHLIQVGFAPDRARKLAQIYLANRKFAKLDQVSNVADNSDDDGLSDSSPSTPVPSLSPVSKIAAVTVLDTPQSSNMLAQYTIPLGENQATLVFTGTALAEEDFDALSDFVEFAKKQFVRKAKAQQPQPKIQIEDDLL